ncbi:MAG: flippase-like domain-containing protein [Actinobacteria bacterium]|nr:MAG: flippase-like domain-containing protein [Actinomycetota bacterium]
MTEALRVVVRRAWFRVLVGVALLGLVGLALWWRGPDWNAVYHAFDFVEWHWIALAVLINLASVSARAVAWHLVVNQALPSPHPRHRTVFAAFCVGLLANAVLPARAGEIARVAVLRRRLATGRGTTATLAGTVFAHRLFDLFPVLALVGYTLEAAKVPRWALTSIEAFIGVGVTLLAVAVVIAHRQHRPVLDEMGTPRKLLAMAQRGLAVMKRPGAAAGATLFQTIGWTLQLFAVYTVMRAFGFGTVPAAALVLVLMNVATVFPFWPGNVGLLQAAIALPLATQYGVDYGKGFAYGLALQAVEMSVGVGLGLVFLAREGLSFANLRGMGSEGDDSADEPAEGAADPRPEDVPEDEPARAGLPG